MPTLLVDKHLRPIRQQIYNLISENSSIIDIGCGHGTQLIMLSPKIKYGLGIDKLTTKINYANSKKLSNLEFQVLDINNLNQLNQTFNYAILSMVFHSLNKKTQNYLMKNIPADNIIIIDYIKSPSKIRNFLAHFEELFSRHYKNFRNYMKEKNKFGEEIKTFDSGIKIWKSF